MNSIGRQAMLSLLWGTYVLLRSLNDFTPALERTGKLEIVNDSIVKEVLYDVALTARAADYASKELKAAVSEGTWVSFNG